MKSLLLASLFLALPAQAKVKAPCQYTFTVDARPVDGNFQKITIEKDEFDTYTAKHQVITAGFGFPVSDTTEEIGTGLACEETKKGRKLISLHCSVDLRPADGELVELTLTRDEEGFYNATLHTATYATLQGPGTDETVELAYGLKYER